MLYVRNGYPKSRQHHDATIDKLESGDETPLKPSVKILLIRGVVMITYLLLGGLVFRALEYHKRDKEYWGRTLVKERQRILKDFNISATRLNDFENLIKKRRYELFTSHKDWDYYQSLYFASTVTTTIGYGHITPQTQGGRIFLIMYALIGIPLNILALASVGEHITVAIFHFLRYVSIRWFHKNRIKHINIKVMLVSVVLMVFMLFIGGLLYCSTEEWTYIDSIYYCFVAMATIGFGDLVPNRGRAPDTKDEKAIWFLRALYISIGLSLVSTVFTALSNAMEEINFLLEKNKPDNNSSQDEQGDNIFKRKTKSDTERISYKHKIKKHGNVALKCKLFQYLKSKKECNFIHTDWDSLLEESKRKQANTTNISPTLKTGNGVVVKKPTLLLLADQKNGFPQNYTLETSVETNVLTLPLTPDGETISSRVSGSENSSPSSMSRLRLSGGISNRHLDSVSFPQQQHQKEQQQYNVRRLHSSPAEYGGHHCSRVNSHPVDHMHINESYLPRQNFGKMSEDFPNNSHYLLKRSLSSRPYREYARNYIDYNGDNRNDYLETDNSQNSSEKYHSRTPREYEIILNQC